MTIEEQKAALDKVATEINQKLDSSTAAIEEGKKVSTKMKDDLNGLVESHKEYSEKMNTAFEAQTKRADEIETKLKRVGEDAQKGETFGDKMEKAFQETFDKKGNVQGTYSFDDMDTKAIMLQSTLVGDVITPDRVNGIISPLERNRHMRPFFAQGKTNSNAVDYIEETSYTDGTAGVLEGNAFPQSDLVLTQQTANVKKVGVHSVISREMLEDVAGLMSYVQGRLIAKYNQKEDTDLIAGDGIGVNLLGVGTNAVAWADPGIIANGNEFDVLRAAVLQAQQAEYFPNLILLNPAELFKMDVTKDANGNYMLPYIFNGQGHNIAGIQIVASTAIAADAFLVGDFARGAQIFDRRNVTLEVASENADDFLKDLVTVKLSTRLALPIYRQGVFIGGTMSTAKTALAT